MSLSEPQDARKTLVLTGASRGIGHEMVRQYREDGWRVIATARKQEDCDELAHMGATAHQLDVQSADSIAALGWRLDDEQVDVAWLVAGVYGPSGSGFPTGPEFDAVMHTNVLAAMRLIPILGPLLVDGADPVLLSVGHLLALAALWAAARGADPADRRRVVLTLTDSAVALVDSCYGPLGGATLRLLATMSPKELATVEAFLRAGVALQREAAARIRRMADGTA